jgi:DnaK suppressor protein
MSVPTLSTRPTVESALKADELALLRALLLCDLAEQLKLVAEHRGAADELLGTVDPDDGSVDRELVEVNAVSAEVAVRGIRRALDRFDNGTYGLCERCGRPIPFERLEAIPSALVCVPCLAATPSGLSRSRTTTTTPETR